MPRRPAQARSEWLNYGHEFDRRYAPGQERYLVIFFRVVGKVAERVGGELVRYSHSLLTSLQASAIVVRAYFPFSKKEKERERDRVKSNGTRCTLQHHTGTLHSRNGGRWGPSFATACCVGKRLSPNWARSMATREMCLKLLPK